MKLKLLVLASLSALLLTISAPVPAHAASKDLCERKTAGSFLGLPVWYKYLNPTFNDNGTPGNTSDDSCDLNANFSSPSTYAAILLAIFEILMRIAGLAAVVFVIVGGFLFITSDGQPDKAKKARWTIFNALIGLGIAMVAVAAVNLIGNTLTT